MLLLPFLISAIGPWQIVLVVVVVLLGSGIKEFKNASKEEAKETKEKE